MTFFAVEHLSREFGGVRAISGINLTVAEEQIFGLIGPNGAGKSTLFNVVTGVYPATAGRVVFDDHDITRWRPHEVSRAGLLRTFQTSHIFSGVSVLENVLLGQSRFAYSGLLSLVPWLADRREAALRQAAYRALDFLDLVSYASTPAGELPYALQRKVEVARALAGRPRLLLLDEPAAGLNEEESRQLAADIRRIRDDGIAVLLIEHDMSVVMETCERIAVLNFGEKIAEGRPEEIQEDPRVIEAYLGREDEHEPAAVRSPSVG